MLLQVAPRHELHADVAPAHLLADVVDAHDVRVREAARRAGLGAEARQRLGVLAQVLRQDLQRHDLVQLVVARLEHEAHRPAPDLLQQLVAAARPLAELRHHRAALQPQRVAGGALQHVELQLHVAVVDVRREEDLEDLLRPHEAVLGEVALAEVVEDPLHLLVDDELLELRQREIQHPLPGEAQAEHLDALVLVAEVLLRALEVGDGAVVVAEGEVGLAQREAQRHVLALAQDLLVQVGQLVLGVRVARVELHGALQQRPRLLETPLRLQQHALAVVGRHVRGVAAEHPLVRLHDRLHLPGVRLEDGLDVLHGLVQPAGVDERVREEPPQVGPVGRGRHQRADLLQHAVHGLRPRLAGLAELLHRGGHAARQRVVARQHQPHRNDARLEGQRSRVARRGRVVGALLLGQRARQVHDRLAVVRMLGQQVLVLPDRLVDAVVAERGLRVELLQLAVLLVVLQQPPHQLQHVVQAAVGHQHLRKVASERHVAVVALERALEHEHRVGVGAILRRQQPCQRAEMGYVVGAHLQRLAQRALRALGRRAVARRVGVRQHAPSLGRLMAQGQRALLRVDHHGVVAPARRLARKAGQQVGVVRVGRAGAPKKRVVRVGGRRAGFQNRGRDDPQEVGMLRNGLQRLAVHGQRLVVAPIHGQEALRQKLQHLGVALGAARLRGQFGGPVGAAGVQLAPRQQASGGRMIRVQRQQVVRGAARGGVHPARGQAAAAQALEEHGVGPPLVRQPLEHRKRLVGELSQLEVDPRELPEELGLAVVRAVRGLVVTQRLVQLAAFAHDVSGAEGDQPLARLHQRQRDHVRVQRLVRLVSGGGVRLRQRHGEIAPVGRRVARPREDADALFIPLPRREHRLGKAE